MIDNLFIYLSDAMNQSWEISLFASFIWGILSIILSPCHLSSIPLVVGYISSQGKITLMRIFLISLIFSVGILITIGLVGLITASLGRMMGDVGALGNYFVAAIFFIVGLYLLDIIKLNWDFAASKTTKQKGLLAAFILGLIFGIALGPCTFAYMAPVLGVVFSTAQTDYFYSVSLLAAFGIGHCGVIVLAGTLSGKVQKYLNWNEGSDKINLLRKICGILVILGGCYLIYTTF